MTKLLILGAGIYQVPLIKKAKSMGLYTIVASYAGNYPGLSLADKVWEVDTTDADRLTALALEEGISGVCTSGTDVAIISLGTICEKLGLRGISAACANKVTDKALMKEAFFEKGVSTPAFCKVYTLNEALQAFEKFQAPAVIKAVDSSGSRGITRVDRKEEIPEAYYAAKKVSKKDYVLVEKFIAACEIGVDGFIFDGKIEFMLPHDKFTHTINGTTLPEGHQFPYQCSPSLEEKIYSQMELAASAVGMKNCAVNADVLIAGDQVYILEIGARAGATCIPELISIYWGFDYYEQMIRQALGKTPDYTRQAPVPCMAKLLFSKRDGILTDINLNRLKELGSNRCDISLDYPIGSGVEGVQNGTSRIGQVILRSERIEELDLIMSQVRKTIKVNGVDLETLWNE